MDNLLEVGKVFSERLFCVPDYQRGYAWEERQCKDFVEDLELLPPNKRHFLGLLIVYPHREGNSRIVGEKGNPRTLVDVVDGQQRLTTIVLYLNALRQEMAEFEGLTNLALGLQENYLTMRDLNEQPVPILTLNRDTHTFFRDSVLNPDQSIMGPTIRSHRLLADASRFFKEYLARKREELDADFPGWLKDEYLKIGSQLTLVLYAVDDEADAGVVFETMNNRGKELTELEKVKNYLLYLAGKLELPTVHDLVNDVNETWTYVFEQLMAANLSSVNSEDRLLRAHWLMAYDYDPKNWDGSRSIKNRFSLRTYEGRHAALLDDLKVYLASLRNATTAYCDIHNPTASSAHGGLNLTDEQRQRIEAAAQRLNRLDTPSTFLPLLFAFRIKTHEEINEYQEALELVEKFIFRVYRWQQRPSYTGRTWMFRLGHNLYHGQDPESVLNEIREAIHYYCTDQQFRHRLEEPEGDWFHWRGIKYLLYEYEQYLADKDGDCVKVPWRRIARRKESIEHILPQTPAAEGYWRERFSKEQHRRWVHDLGNLTLTLYNPVLGNKPFPEKKGKLGQPRCYASSKVFAEYQLVNYSDWGIPQIEERRKELADWAMMRWHVDLPVPAVGEGPPRPTNKVERVVELARERGVVDGFTAILDAARKNGLHLRPFKTCVMIAPPAKKSVALFTVWPQVGFLQIGVWPGNFPPFYQIEKERVISIMGWDRTRRIPDDEADEFAARIDQLCREIGQKPNS